MSSTASAISVQALEGNRILASLSPDTRRRMLPALKVISLEVSLPLYAPFELMTPVYFPLTAVTSIFSEMGATVGSEGMVGLPIFLGDETTSLRTRTQIAGTALWMGQEEFLSVVDDETSGLRRVLLRYTQALLYQLAQHSACNGSHTMEQRCARWILMTHDRVGQEELALTPEFLAYMLGARRGSVTIAAGILANAGLIRCTRGTVCVLDRPRLEEASCDCYGIIQREYERLIGKA